jgi:hypothetical protein
LGIGLGFSRITVFIPDNQCYPNVSEIIGFAMRRYSRNKIKSQDVSKSVI